MPLAMGTGQDWFKIRWGSVRNKRHKSSKYPVLPFSSITSRPAQQDVKMRHSTGFSFYKKLKAWGKNCMQNKMGFLWNTVWPDSPVSSQLNCFDFCGKFYFDNCLLFQIIPNHHCSSRSILISLKMQLSKQQTLFCKLVPWRICIPQCTFNTTQGKPYTPRSGVSKSTLTISFQR